MIAAIIQARMGSTRLPGKVMKPLCGKPMLWHIITRLGYSKQLKKIIIATTDKEEDKVIVKFAEEMGIDYYCGSSEDVLDRYYQAAKQFNISHIIRVTADCPLVDAELIDLLVARHKETGADCTHNLSIFDSRMPDGTDIEVFNINALYKSWREGREPHHREHVDEYIYEHPELFKIEKVSAPPWINRPDYRLTVDYPEDFELISNIFEHFHPVQPSIREVIEFLDVNQHLLNINAHRRSV